VISPAHLWVPPRVGSYGDEAADLAERAGRVLDEEQRLAVDAMLSYGPGGRWVAMESAVIEARQNGKTGGVLLPVTLFDLFLLPPDRIVWTAHLFRTARDAFDDFCTCIETAPELSRRVKNISYGHGEEFIELHRPKNSDSTQGAKLEFLARSKGGGRGLGGKRVVMDEALFLMAAAMGALMPVLSARPDPQINYGSSAALATSDHLHRLKDRGRAGNDPYLIWIEFCASGGWVDPPCEAGARCAHTPGTPGCALDDERMWAPANHTLGKRITIDYVRAERRALPAIEFGRERLGWHEIPVVGSAAIDIAQWADLLDAESKREGDIALAVDIAPQRDYAVTALYGLRAADGLGHWQIVDYRPGTEWLVDRIVELRDGLKPIAIAMGRATAASLEVELEKHGIHRPEKPDEPARGDLAVLTAAEMTASTGQALDVVRQRGVKHIGQQPLDAAVAGAKTREIGDTVAWSRKDASADISPLVAVSEARWAYYALAHLVDKVDEPFNIW
jgi:hypothetical protein